MPVVPKNEFARIVGCGKSAVSNWIANGTIHGDAIVGTGRNAMIDVDKASAQLRLRNIGQMGGNGAATRVFPKTSTPGTPADNGEGGASTGDVEPSEPQGAVSADTQERIARERLKEAERRNRLGDDDEAARCGIFTLTGDMNRSMNVVAVQMMRAFEGMLPDMATAVAAELKAEYRDVLHIMMQSSLKARERMAERAAASGAHIPKTHEVDAAALLRSHREESP